MSEDDDVSYNTFTPQEIGAMMDSSFNDGLEAAAKECEQSVEKITQEQIDKSVYSVARVRTALQLAQRIRGLKK